MMSHALRTPHSALRTSRAFTMIEIALSLAIIGFALVAIIGVLPIGMNTQKVNREETIINQDATVFMNAIRNGVKGLDDLTNYVTAITNAVTLYDQTLTNVIDTRTYGYTTTNSSTSLQFPLINGLRIVGLLSTPKYLSAPLTDRKGEGVLSNYVVAYVRSLSGAASEKFPQNNPAVQDLAYTYRMTSEVIPYGTYSFDRFWFRDTAPVANNLQNNLRDVRLVFRWPLLSRGQVGRSGQAFHTLAAGSLQRTNEPGFAGPIGSPYDLYFIEPQTYVKAP